jgi:hypothetical protein
MSPCIVLLWMWIGFICPKYSLVYIVVELVYMLPTNSIASKGYLRSSMIVKSRVWSMEPKAFLKSMYNMYMSWFVSLASSSAAISICICLVVLLSCQNPSWLLCSIWCCSPYVDKMDVRVLINNLYIVFASTIGLWFASSIGFPFKNNRMVLLIFQ